MTPPFSLLKIVYECYGDGLCKKRTNSLLYYVGLTIDELVQKVAESDDLIVDTWSFGQGFKLKTRWK